MCTTGGRVAGLRAPSKRSEPSDEGTRGTSVDAAVAARSVKKFERGVGLRLMQLRRCPFHLTRCLRLYWTNRRSRSLRTRLSCRAHDQVDVPQWTKHAPPRWQDHLEHGWGSRNSSQPRPAGSLESAGADARRRPSINAEDNLGAHLICPAKIRRPWRKGSEVGGISPRPRSLTAWVGPPWPQYVLNDATEF